MNFHDQSFIKRLSCYLLIAALSLSSPTAIARAEAQALSIVFESVRQSGEGAVERSAFFLSRFESEAKRSEENGRVDLRKYFGGDKNVEGFINQPITHFDLQPSAQDENRFFNGPIIFTTMMENATKPACGCSGEPAYNQGISLVAGERPKCASVGSFPGIDQDTGGATVFLHNGEFFHYQVDLEIKGRGFNWRFERKYRSGIDFEGPIGHNWEFNYNRRLFIKSNGDVIRMDGYGRADRYHFNGSSFDSPAGYYTQLRSSSGGAFTERDKNGTKVFYSPPDSRKICRMTELRDRNGNRMRFIYNSAGQLKEVIETLGRSIYYRYNTEGHLVEVEDFSGRKIKFEYDEVSNTARIGTDDLIAVTSPQVTLTPNGNDFPEGKTARYVYSFDMSDEKLNHNLVEIIAPNEVATGGQPRVTVDYDNDLNSPNADRVLRQTTGGMNGSGVAAGGTIFYEYQSLGTAPPGNFITPVFQTRVMDRNRNLAEYQFNQIANIVRIREFANRNIRRGDPPFFENRYEYNRDGEMTRQTMPEGNSVENVYDERNSSRFQQGNLLSQTRLPDAERGGDQAFLRTSTAYEPIYNQVRTQTDPRGNDPGYVPQNGGPNSPDRYTTFFIFDYQEGSNFAALAQEVGISEMEVRALLAGNNIQMGLGDLNGDGQTDQIAGNLVKVIRPAVALLSDSNMARLEGSAAQPVVELYQYNQFGQMIRRIDAEANVDTFDYHPENDPDGDGLNPTAGVGSGPFGYLKETIKDVASNPARDTGTDPKPAAIRQKFFCDRVGNLIKEVDGRGIATAYSVNQLDQVVEIRRAADVSEARANSEEPNWNACSDSTLVECRAGMTAFNYRVRIFYDNNNNIVKREVENRDSNNASLAGDFIDYTFVHDILDNTVEERREVSENPAESLVTKYRYDPNENRVLEISPIANLAPGNTERQPANVVSSVVDERDLFTYVTRGGLTSLFRTLSGHFGDTEIATIPNSPDISTFERGYDGNRNLIRSIDCADNNGDGRPEVTLTLFDGFDRPQSTVDAVGNQGLTRYDPASNIVSASRFGLVGGRSPSNNAAATLRQPLHRQDISQPLLSQTEFKFDELSRMFERDVLLFDYRNQGVRYARAPILRDGPLGGSNDGVVATRFEYDRNSRRTFLIEDDLDTFQTFYDGAGRAIHELDPEGNTIDREYDDDDNIVKVTETEITQRKDVMADRVPDLEEKFTTINIHDSLNRQIRVTDNIGQTTRFEYDSRDNVIHTSDAQHSRSDADLIADPLGRFPVAGQSVARINRPGNTMDYFYDGSKRKVAKVHQLRVDGQGKNAIDMSNPANPDGLIVIDYLWGANSRLRAMADDGSSSSDQNTSIGVIESTNAKGNVTRYVYDELNRLDREVFDDGTIKDYTYNCDDNLFCVVDQNGSTITRRFDAINRLVQINVTRATSRTAHKAGGFKDPTLKWKITGTTLQTLEYDGLSRMTASFDNNDPEDRRDDASVRYAYDSLSRVLEENQSEGVVSSRWAGDNNRVGLIYPNGREIAMTFDHLDRIDRTSDATTESIADYDYIGPDRVLERNYASGARLTRLNDNRTAATGFDALRRVVSQRHFDNQNSLTAGFDYSYDQVNNKFFEKENRGSDTVRSENYEYDSTYRLTRFARQDEEEDNWQLDGVGNWAKRRNLTNEVNNMNEYTAFGRSASGTTIGVPLQSGNAQMNDDNGNLLDDGTNLYEYDTFNRLRKVTRKSDRATVAVYDYDAHNRRFKAIVNKTRSGSLDFNDCVLYFYDGWREIEETRTGPTGQRVGPTQQYVYGMWIDEPLTLDLDENNDGRIEPSDNAGDGDSDRFDQVARDKRFFYHEDGKGYIAVLTDHQGAVVERYRYDAYGVPIITDGAGMQRNQSIANNRYLFAGRRFDPESGLYYYRNRFMDPRTGRFINRDPSNLWTVGLDRGNPYVFLEDNPGNRVYALAENMPTEEEASEDESTEEEEPEDEDDEEDEGETDDGQNDDPAPLPGAVPPSGSNPLTNLPLPPPDTSNPTGGLGLHLGEGGGLIYNGGWKVVGDIMIFVDVRF